MKAVKDAAKKAAHAVGVGSGTTETTTPGATGTTYAGDTGLVRPSLGWRAGVRRGCAC